MSSIDEPKLAPNPIHIVGNPNAKDQVAARYEALRAFHQGLDEAASNLRSLLPRTHAMKTASHPPFEFVVTDESVSYGGARGDPHGSSGPAPSVAFEQWSPWITDVDAADVPQPA